MANWGEASEAGLFLFFLERPLDKLARVLEFVIVGFGTVAVGHVGRLRLVLH